MSSRVRLLPALIGAAGVLMMLRIGAMAASTPEQTPASTAEAPAAETPAPAGEAAADKPAEHAAEKPEGEKTEDEKTAGGKEAEPHVASAEAEALAAQQAQTKGEAEVLLNLTERRAALEARERDIAMREQLMSATEKRVEERLGELKGLEEKLNAMLAKRDAEEEAQLTSLVKTYENMKPADAAKIFNKLDRTIMLSVASRMKPAKIGALMAAMEPQRAQELTVLLATRMKVAKAQALAAPSVAPPPPPVAPVAPEPAPIDATPAPTAAPASTDAPATAPTAPQT